MGDLEHVRRIMVERLWFPRFIGEVGGRQRWCVYSWVGLCNLRDTSAVVMNFGPNERPVLVYDDPITALIETDRFYREKVKPLLDQADRG